MTPTEPSPAFSVHSPQKARCAGFTLVEMVVVVAIIVIIVGLVAPAASTLWSERKVSEAVNTVQGLLMTARANAVRADGVDTGLLFFVDAQGVQRAVTIANKGPSEAEQSYLRTLSLAESTVKRAIYRDVFEITEDRDEVLPVPMRVVPRYAVDDEESKSEAPSWQLFSDPELANRSFEKPRGGADLTQRHRNFFTLIYSSDAHLLVGRDVLIRDHDADGNRRGDRTDLQVGAGPPHDVPTTTSYYARDGSTAVLDLDPVDDPAPVPFLVVDPNRADDAPAVNFPSVDGLLVYDDTVYRGLPDDDLRDYLREKAQPLYISRWTGVVIRGPLGEGEPPDAVSP